MTFLMRVQLNNIPGQLGKLAAALGQNQADIISIDIVEQNPQYALDDIVVLIDHQSLPDTLITIAESIPGVRVISLKPHVGRLEPHQEFELLNQILTPSEDMRSNLIEIIPKALRVDWAEIITHTDNTYKLSYSSKSAPETKPKLQEWIPITSTQIIHQANWIPTPWLISEIQIVATYISVNEWLIIGRNGGPEFLTSEVNKYDAFANLIRKFLNLTQTPKTTA